MIRLVAVAAALAAFVFLAGAASAQYPAPIGSITSSSSSTSADIRESVVITCAVNDAGGAPLAGRTVTFSISSNPGNASLEESSGTTDSQGVAEATLNVGSSAGQVQVTCQSEGKSSTVTTQVLGARAAANCGRPVRSREGSADAMARLAALYATKTL